MKQFTAFVMKEAKHILRDKRTMLILFGMPIVLMFIFGFAITTDVKNVRTVVVTVNADYQRSVLWSCWRSRNTSSSRRL
jgi:ABC-2 type transport system permease protein